MGVGSDISTLPGQELHDTTHPVCPPQMICSPSGVTARVLDLPTWTKAGLSLYLLCDYLTFQDPCAGFIGGRLTEVEGLSHRYTGYLMVVDPD